MKKEFETLYEATTLEELKKAYRKLALKFHPDNFKDDGSMFIELKEVFDKLYNKLKNVDKDSWKHKNETSEDFMDLIEKLMQFSEIEIEIVGSWLYVSGNGTYAIKEELKTLKFWYSAKYKSWIYSGKQGKTKRRATKINAKKFYGTEVVYSNTQKQLTHA